MTPTEHRPTDSVQMTLEMDPRAITNVVTTGEALDGDVGMNRFQFPAISYMYHCWKCIIITMLPFLSDAQRMYSDKLICR